MLAANVQTFAQRNVVVNLIKIYKSDLNFLSNNQCKIFLVLFCVISNLIKKLYYNEVFVESDKFYKQS